MALPTGWPPRAPSGIRSLRYFSSGTVTTTDFADKALLFSYQQTAFTPMPIVVAGSTNTVNAPTTPAGGGTGSSVDYNASTNTPEVTPMTPAYTIRIFNDGAVDLQFSFDATNVHGVVKAGERLEYRRRFEAGIAFRCIGAGSSAYRLEAW